MVFHVCLPSAKMTELLIALNRAIILEKDLVHFSQTVSLESLVNVGQLFIP